MAIRTKNAADMKFYLYVSTAKVDMLYAQIKAPDKKKISWEFKVGFGLVTAQRKAETEEEVDRDEKLRAIIQELESTGQVGTVDEPSEYIKGTLPMRWGLYDDNGRPANEAPLVFFGNKIEKQMLGLGGSSKHVIGFNGASSTGSRSVTPYLVAWLLNGLEQPLDGWHAYHSMGESDEYQTFQALQCALEIIKGPEQNLEFFAKTLLQGRTLARDNETWVDGIIGTPLYVALAAPYPKDLW